MHTKIGIVVLIYFCHWSVTGQPGIDSIWNTTNDSLKIATQKIQPGKVLRDKNANGITILQAFATIGANDDNFNFRSQGFFSWDQDDTLQLVYLSGRRGGLEISRSENVVPQF